jgi:hypothetical protein
MYAQTHRHLVNLSGWYQLRQFVDRRAVDRGRFADDYGYSEQLQNLPLRDFDLRGHYVLVSALDSWPAALDQLSGAKRGQHHELKRTHPYWTLDHKEPIENRTETGMAALTQKLW